MVKWGFGGMLVEFQTGTLGVQCVCGAEQTTNAPHVRTFFLCVCVYTDSYKIPESRFLLKAQHCGAVMMTYLLWGCRSTLVILYSVIALLLLLVQVLETGLVLRFCMVLCHLARTAASDRSTRSQA